VKRFGHFIANDSIDVTFHNGKIHALLGENGAGKSTFVKVLAGINVPEEGSIAINGDPVRLDSPRRARMQGIAVVHQSSSLVPALTVAENTMLLTDRLGPVDRSIRQEIVRTADALGFSIDPDARVDRLSVGQRQRAEIVRALLHEARLVILDEPTAVLAPQESDELFALLRRLATAGTGVVVVTHRLDEALTKCDRLTVLRGGRVVGASTDPSQMSENELINMLVGEIASYSRRARTVGERVLQARGLAGSPAHGHRLNGLDLDVRAGEVLGIAGVEGNGQRELTSALVGAWQPEIGSVELDGRSIFEYTGRERAKLIADIPDDDGVAVLSHAPIWQNLALADLSWEKSPSPRQRKRQRGAAAQLVEQFEIKTESVDTLVGRLSGGNRRRVVLAREFTKNPRLVVASYATKGLDVRSVAMVKDWISRLAAQGAAVVYVASELEELHDISDRIAVMARGRVTGILPAASADSAEIGRLMLADQNREVTTA
jgi:simple sugar transport system ATP-binding protein